MIRITSHEANDHRLLLTTLESVDAAKLEAGKSLTKELRKQRELVGEKRKVSANPRGYVSKA
jgi:hypothetical protein